jgi:hypothetical protein
LGPAASLSPLLSGKHDSRQKEAEVALHVYEARSAQAGGMFDRCMSRRQDPLAARLDDDVRRRWLLGRNASRRPSSSSRSLERTDVLSGQSSTRACVSYFGK